MKIDQFENMLQHDLAWRKVEISQLFMILNSSDSKDVVIKSMVLLLYAHWEGFIKRSSKLYLKYVTEEKIITKELTINFHAIKLKEYARKCIQEDSKNLAQELTFLNAQNKIEEKKFSCKVEVDNDLDEDIINTGHNLNSKVLKAIIEIVGSKYNDAMQTRANYIDAVLLNNRNSIGHAGKMATNNGNGFEITYDEVIILKNFVIMMLDYYSDILCDYVTEKYYLKCNESQRLAYEELKEQELTRKISELDNLRKAV